MPRKQPEGYRIRPWRGKLALVWYEGGRRRRHSLGTNDPQEAERLRASVVAEVERQSRPERPTIGQIMEAYQAAKLPEVSSPWAIENAWKALRPHFGALYPEHVTEESCKAYQTARTDAGKALGTPRQELGVLRSALRWAEKKKMIDRAPHVWQPPAPPPRERHLTRKEGDRLIAAAEMPHIRLYILLGLYTAGRMRALLDLTWSRVDFERRRITLKAPGEIAKRQKGRATVPIGPTLYAALAEAKKGALTDYVIEWGGGPVGNIKKGFAAACARAGLEDVTPHTLRHTATVWMIEAGIPIEDAARLLGHKDPATTRKHYGHYAPEHLRAAVEALEGKRNVLPGSVRGSRRNEKRTALPKQRRRPRAKRQKAPRSRGG